MQQLNEIPTVFDPSALSLFVGDDFTDVFDNEAVFPNCLQGFDTPATTIVGAKNA